MALFEPPPWGDMDPWPWIHNQQQRNEEQRKLMDRYTREAQDAAQEAQRRQLVKTVGSARVVDGVLHLHFTDRSQIDIPMAVVSEIVAVVLAGRLAMGFSEEPQK